MPNIELSVSTTFGNIQEWFYLVPHMDNIVKKNSQPKERSSN